MRRIVAAIVLCIFGGLLPSATVLALAAPAPLLPICCRAHGAHHCTMEDASPDARSSSQPAFRDLGCPFRHGLQAITQGPTAVGTRRDSGFSWKSISLALRRKTGLVPVRRLDGIATRGPPFLFS